MIAITVSTNYSDVLPIVHLANKGFFKKWIFVTSHNDSKTIDFLTNNPDLIILYWDFKNHSRTFDKGGAIKYAQEYAYKNFPNDWYLLLDSDICISSSFTEVVALADNKQLNEAALYGVNRYDFSCQSDLRNMKNIVNYNNHSDGIHGFFQLYWKNVFYASSENASQCDLRFNSNFSVIILIDGVNCFHLGTHPHWDGNRQLGSDFVVD
jgi:hypothetical protein